MKLVGFPCKTDFASDKDFCAALFAFLFQFCCQIGPFFKKCIVFI